MSQPKRTPITIELNKDRTHGEYFSGPFLQAAFPTTPKSAAVIVNIIQWKLDNGHYRIPAKSQKAWDFLKEQAAKFKDNASRPVQITCCERDEAINAHETRPMWSIEAHVAGALELGSSASTDVYPDNLYEVLGNIQNIWRNNGHKVFSVTFVDVQR